MGQFEFWLFVSRSGKFKLTQHQKIGEAGKEKSRSLPASLRTSFRASGVTGVEEGRSKISSRIRSISREEMLEKLLESSSILRP